MSAVNAPLAEEVCMLALNPYDAGQRALWHLDRIGSLIDCRTKEVGPDLELLYAVPERGRNFARSSSAEELGIYGDDFVSYSLGGRPCLIEDETRFVTISEKTRLKFLNPVSISVFSIDLSPSMNVVDTSFTSVSTSGCHLVDTLVESLRAALKCLSAPITFPFVPQIFVTVVAHGVPAYGVFPLVIGALLTPCCVDKIIGQVQVEIEKAKTALSEWMQKNYPDELRSGAHHCSRTRSACTSPVCQANDVSLVINDALAALSMTCNQLNVDMAGVNKSLTLVTDGVLAHPRNLPYDNILMRLNFEDVSLHIIQTGGGFAPWSALGYASDPDLLRLLAASTPTGLFLQDHHLDPNFTAAGTTSSRSIFRPIPCLCTNILWMAFSLKFSPLTCGLRVSAHMPYRALSYQSSALVKADAACKIFSYLSLIGRGTRAISIQGIDDQRSTEQHLPVAPHLEESDEETLQMEEPPAVQSLKSYLEPERAKARPYLYKQYRLPGVSIAQILQVRAKEGFLIEHSYSGVASTPTMIQRANSSGFLLTRAASSTSLQASPSNGALELNRDIALRLHWGPVMDVIYEISGAGEDTSPEEDHLNRTYTPRLSEEVRVKIYLRMPSGEFFLRFKQQVAAASGDTNLWQMCRQLDALIETIFSVDDTLTKLTTTNRRIIPKNVHLWHRWFNVRTLVLLGDISPALKEQRIRHGLAKKHFENFRDNFIFDLENFSHSTLDPGNRFFLELSSNAALLAESHTANVLSESNETIAAKLSGDHRFSGTVTDPVTPFMLIDVDAEDPDSNPGAIVRLNVAFFASCPAIQRFAIDQLSNAFKLSGALLVDAPSQILTLEAPSDRFLTHVAWEALCPPASVLSDVLTSIHERRLREGWVCAQETHTSVRYILISPVETETPAISRSRYPIKDPSRHWVPRDPIPRSKQHNTSISCKEVALEWPTTIPECIQSERISRKSIRGPCMCLSVQHFQARGEKPIVRCDLWADIAHPTFNSMNREDIEKYAHELCAFEPLHGSNS